VRQAALCASACFVSILFKYQKNALSFHAFIDALRRLCYFSSYVIHDRQARLLLFQPQRVDDNLIAVLLSIPPAFSYRSILSKQSALVQLSMARMGHLCKEDGCSCF
jgi:hypothetical protein